MGSIIHGAVKQDMASSLILMLPIISIFLAGLVAAQESPAPCCQSKTVGTVSYFFVENRDTSEWSCKDNCVYTSASGGNVCFKSGPLPVTCADGAYGGGSGSGGGGTWPQEPAVEYNYTARGEMVDIDPNMKGYLVGSGEKVIIWSTDTTGITDEKIDSKATKEWADFLAEEGGYTVLIPDWFRGNNQPETGWGADTIDYSWYTQVTNWTKIESDWKNAVLPYLETRLSAPLSIGLIGTCWGSYPVVFLSRFNNIKCGISMHPSHPGLIALSGQDESEVLSKIVAPQLFMSEGISFLPTGLPPSLYAGGLADQILGDKITIEKFDDMMHGWTVGGDLSNPNVAKGVEKAKKLALEFFAKHL